jgi:hypothetical protein
VPVLCRIGQHPQHITFALRQSQAALQRRCVQRYDAHTEQTYDDCYYTTHIRDGYLHEQQRSRCQNSANLYGLNLQYAHSVITDFKHSDVVRTILTYSLTLSPYPTPSAAIQVIHTHSAKVLLLFPSPTSLTVSAQDRVTITLAARHSNTV